MPGIPCGRKFSKEFAGILCLLMARINRKFHYYYESNHDWFGYPYAGR